MSKWWVCRGMVLAVFCGKGGGAWVENGNPILNPKPYYRHFIRDDHFYFRGLGISGWGIWCFYGGIGVWS